LEEHGAPARRLEVGKQARDRALAAPALADERGDRPGPELERDVVDRVDVRPAERVAERDALRELANLERANGAPSSTRWQATRWPGAISRRSGRSLVWRRKCAASSGRQCGQRGW